MKTSGQYFNNARSVKLEKLFSGELLREQGERHYWPLRHERFRMKGIKDALRTLFPKKEKDGDDVRTLIFLFFHDIYVFLI